MNAQQVRDGVRRLVAAGARLAWIFADRERGDTVLHYVVEQGGALRDLPVQVRGAVESLSGEVPAADWYEREAQERFSVTFDGEMEQRPLTCPVPAEELTRRHPSEVSTVLYGPVRSGIAESARWIVETTGENFIEAYPSMFFKHRAVEERFVGTPLDLAPFVAEHVSGATASSHASAFCRAVEKAMDVHVPDRARAARAVLLELERIHQHLDSLGKLAEDGSLSVGSALTFAAKERVHRLLCEATGNRFARGAICVGGTRFDAFGRLRDVCERDLGDVERHARSAIDGLAATQSLLDRLIGTGRLPTSTVMAHGGVGPVARGSNVSCDVRAKDGYLYTPLGSEEAMESNGDAVSRALVRIAEIQRSFQMVRNALDSDPPGPYRTSYATSDGSALARVESPQGELLYFGRISAGSLARVAVRSASYANWPLFVPSLPGNIFTDFSFIDHSFAAIQSEVDR
jgi:formate hydrogenlyase subunit 5